MLIYECLVFLQQLITWCVWGVCVCVCVYVHACIHACVRAIEAAYRRKLEMCPENALALYTPVMNCVFEK